MSFTHLHVHSEYSLLDGLIKLDDLFNRLHQLEMDSVALTDHGAMYGALHFYIKAKKNGIKPIIGLEAYKATRSRFDKQIGIDQDQYHLTLLAKNYTGYKNLLKLTTASHLDGFYYKPRLDFELLQKHKEGIICLTGCMSGEISSLIADNRFTEAEKVLKKYLAIYKDDLYIEIQRYPNVEDLDKINKDLIQLSRKYAVPIVATNDVHYLHKDQAYAQEILLCIQSQQTIYDSDRKLSMINTPEFYLKSASEMKGLFIDIPEAIENTQKIKDMCSIDIPYGKWILPIYDTPDNKDAKEYLYELTFEKAKTRLEVNDKVKERLKYELNIITKKDYATYFLIVQDFVNWAKKQGIAVGPGRGSAAGSLVAYALHITDINPLDYELPFERFLNPDRPTPPDFDIDFADTRRDEVLKYVTDKYGKDKVAQIITFGRMEARLAIRDVSRALGMSYSQGDRIAKMVPQGKQGFAMSVDKALEENPQLKFAYDNEEDVKKALDIARQVEGVARHSSVHAAGVVIADKPLVEYVPLQRESKAGRIITQYDMYALDLNAVSDNQALGLLKMDFLGLRNLSIIEHAVAFIKKFKNIDIDIHNIPLNDSKTYELISSGKTIGVFQLESRGMRRLAKDLSPNKLSDITAMVALYRPGPMDLIPIFLEGKKNQRKIHYLHKDLKPILGETYGVLVYQEQVMQIAHQLAGFSMSEADNLRMAMGKKKKSLMKQEKIKFLSSCVNKGYTQILADKVFSFIEKFAAYGFNKPHSASYALIAYWTAFLKANYSIEYMTALLTAELQGSAGSQREAKIFQAIEECKQLNIDVLPPNINKSDFDFSIENKAIRFGLSAIKNVGKAAIDSILDARTKSSFTGLKEFLLRVELRKVNKKTVESLIQAGAFDSFGSRSSLLAYYATAIEEIAYLKKHQDQGQDSLFSVNSNQNTAIDKLPKIDEFSDDEIMSLEKLVFGFSLTKNPLNKYKSILNSKITAKIGELGSDDIGKTHILGGTISTVKIVITKKTSSKMAFVTLYDETGSLELLIFPKLFQTNSSVFRSNSSILIKGKLDDKDGNLVVLVDQVVNLSKLKTD